MSRSRRCDRLTDTGFGSGGSLPPSGPARRSRAQTSSAFGLRNSHGTFAPGRPITLTHYAGFSLVELMIVLSLCGLFMSAVYEAVITGLRAVSAADRREAIRQQLTSALERMIRDAGAADGVDVADTDEFQFDTPSVNDVEYLYDSGGDTLSRDDAGSSQRVILRNLTAFDFSYVDGNGAQLSEPVAGSAEDTIRVVQVSATVTQGSEAITIEDAVFLRNL